MKLYRTRTESQFKWLMEYLDKQGCKWHGGDSLVNGSLRTFNNCGDNTVITANNDNTVSYSSVDYIINKRGYDIDDIIEVGEMEEYGAVKINDNTIINADGIIWKDYDRLTINDTINHPSHYTQGEYEAIDVILDMVEGYTHLEKLIC